MIVSQNDIHGHRAGTSGSGAGIGFSDGGPERAWFIFNRIHDNHLGFKLSSSSASPNVAYYVIGNVIHDIHGDGSPFGGSWQQPGTAVTDYHRDSAQKYFVGNTVYDTDYGFVFWGPNEVQRHVVANNIFSQMAVGNAPMIHVEHSVTAGAVEVYNNLFDGQLGIYWGGPNYTTLSSFQAATGQGVGCLVGDARFRDAAQADFHLLGDSPAVDSGAAAGVYNTFLSLYGIDIRVDIEGTPIPLDGNGNGTAVIDIGSFEYRRP